MKVVFPAERAQEMHDAARSLRRDLSRSCRASSVESAASSSVWRDVFGGPTAAQWLSERCRMPKQEAVERLKQIEVNPLASLAELAGNPRWMIGLIAALHDAPDALIFTTTGCDPAGIERALAAVQTRLNRTAAVYLSCFPQLNIAEPRYAAVLRVQSCEQKVA